MTLFARNSDFFGDDEVGAYVAFITIAKKKGGRPVKFVFYRFLSVGPKGMFESIEFSCHQEKEAKEAFPFGPTLYRPIEEESDGMRDLIENQKFPRSRINPWRKTTDWLSDVAVGGSRYPRGSWVKLRKRPYTWRKDGPRKKKKLRLKFGSLEHRLLVVRDEIACLKRQTSKKIEELDILHHKYNKTKGEEKRRLLLKKVAVADAIKALEVAVDDMEARESRIIAEMKYVRDKKFPPTVSP